MERKIEITLDVDAAIAAIDAGAEDGIRLGADLVAVEAKAIAPQRTGQLVNSIQAGAPQGQFSAGELFADIGAGAPYSVFVEFGTGVYAGGEPIWIEPRRRQALRFPLPGGGFAFSKGHFIQGMRAQPYMRPAVEQNAEEIAEVIADAIDDAIDEAFSRR